MTRCGIAPVILVLNARRSAHQAARLDVERLSED